MVAGPAMREATDSLDAMAKDLTSEFISLSVRAGEVPEPPEPLTEPSDMLAVESPCHPWEPVKIADGWIAPLHCLVCGNPYVV